MTSVWPEFLDDLRRFANLPAGVRPDHQINEVCGDDRVMRSILAAALRRLLRDPPQELLDSIETFGEAEEWYEARRDLAAETRTSPTGVGDRSGVSVRLRALRETDINPLYTAAIDPRWGHLWRYRGAVPSPEEFRAGLYPGTLTQFVAESTITNKLVGLVCAYNARLEAGTVFIGLIRAAEPEAELHSEMIEAFYLFINYLFDTWPFRKLYAEIAGFGWHQFASGEDEFFEVEGVLREHDFHAGQWWDQRIIAIYRDRWRETCESRLDGVFSLDGQPDRAGARDYKKIG